MGGGAALAGTGSSDPASDFLGDVAQRLGISEDKLEGAIEDATIARIDEAVAEGHITEEQAEKLKEGVRSGDAPAILPHFGKPRLGDGPRLGLAPRLGIGPPPKIGPHVMPGRDLMGTAADYLGMDLAELREDLHDGKSLADLAKEEGKSVDGLKRALREELGKHFERALDKLVEGRFELHLRDRPGRTLPLPILPD